MKSKTERPAGGLYRHSAPILTDTQRPVTRESFKLAVTLMSHTNTYKQTVSLLVKMTTDIVKIKRDVNNTHECCAIIRIRTTTFVAVDLFFCMKTAVRRMQKLQIES